jgi:hypothetical protein
MQVRDISRISITGIRRDRAGFQLSSLSPRIRIVNIFARESEDVQLTDTQTQRKQFTPCELSATFAATAMAICNKH